MIEQKNLLDNARNVLTADILQPDQNKTIKKWISFAIAANIAVYLPTVDAANGAWSHKQGIRALAVPGPLGLPGWGHRANSA